MNVGHAERTHRRYSPSRADRIALCPGSVNMEDRVPFRTESQYAIEGTKAHIVLEAALANSIRSAREAHTEYSELCMEPLDERFDGPYSMFYMSINRMLDEVNEILDLHPDAILFTERFVNPPCYVAPGEAGGYCDCAIWAPSIKRLWVIDYKHGAGVTKSVVGNRQVKQYGAGFVFDEQSPLWEVTVERPELITLMIVQPRAFHKDGETRSYDLTLKELADYVTEMNQSIARAHTDDAPLNPGEEQCQFCEAKVECPARQALMLDKARTNFATVRDVVVSKLPILDLMTAEDFAWGSHAFPLMEKYIEQFYRRRNELMRAGYDIPGFKMVETDARRQWFGDPLTFAPQLAAMAGVQEMDLWSQKFITLTEAEKLVVSHARKGARRGMKDAAAEDIRKAFALFVDKKTTGNLTVVDDSDPRPSINAAARDFQQVAGLISPPSAGE